MSETAEALPKANYQVAVDPMRRDLGGNHRHGDLGIFTPALWRFLKDRFAVRSMLDVGCGEGHGVSFWHNMGVFAHGIDGMRSNVERAVMPIALHDLLQGPYYMPVDFVWSCEVAEHIAPAKVDNFVDTLANGKVIAMTHALPGQGGYHHVNCQPAEYWIEKFARRGYVLAPDVEHVRRLAAREGHFNYFQKSGLLFVRGDGQPS